MKLFQHITVCLLALLVVEGCASTKVTDRQPVVTERLPRPDHILVYDFVATPNDAPAQFALADHHPSSVCSVSWRPMRCVTRQHL